LVFLFFFFFFFFVFLFFWFVSVSSVDARFVDARLSLRGPLDVVLGSLDSLSSLLLDKAQGGETNKVVVGREGDTTGPVAVVAVSNCCNASNLVCSAFLRADSARFFIRNARGVIACFVLLEVVVLLVGFELLGLVGSLDGEPYILFGLVSLVSGTALCRLRAELCCRFFNSCFGVGTGGRGVVAKLKLCMEEAAIATIAGVVGGGGRFKEAAIATIAGVVGGGGRLLPNNCLLVEERGCCRRMLLSSRGVIGR
jgi:hypothetical protein